MDEFIKLLDENLDYLEHRMIGDTIYIYPMTICRETPTSIKVGDNDSYVPG